MKSIIYAGLKDTDNFKIYEYDGLTVNEAIQKTCNELIQKHKCNKKDIVTVSLYTRR